MKKLFTIFLSAACLTASAQWNAQNTGTLRSFDKVFFPSSSVGYAIPFQGPVFKTTNGGASWDSLNTIEMNAAALYDNSIWFVNDSLGFVSTNNGTNARLYRTSNGGAAWNNVSPSAGMYGVFRIQFMSAQTGYAYAGNGFGDSIWMTSDGGNTWINRGFSNTISNGISSGARIYFVNDSTGYVSGNDGTFGYRAVIHKTTNYGLSWDADTLGVNTVSNVLHFATEDTGFIVSQWNGVIRTTNAGASWDTVSDISIMNNVVDLHFLNGQTGFMLMNNAVYKTNDGGDNWTLQYSGTRELHDIHFNAANQGYITGDSGLILKIADGLSVNKISNNLSFSLYPNPAQDVLKIHSAKSTTAVTAYIYNSLGVLVAEAETEGNIDVSQLPGGIYFLIVKDKLLNSAGHARFIIAR